MAAVAHESLAEDEILRSADELKKAVSDANVGDKIPALPLDRSAYPWARRSDVPSSSSASSC